MVKTYFEHLTKAERNGRNLELTFEDPEKKAFKDKVFAVFIPEDEFDDGPDPFVITNVSWPFRENKRTPTTNEEL